MSERITMSMLMPSIRSKRQVKHGRAASADFYENLNMLNGTRKVKSYRKTGAVDITPYISFKSA